MTVTIFNTVLFLAAALYAGRNTRVKSGPDQLASTTFVTVRGYGRITVNKIY